jgi:hypothetical protein
MFCSNPRVEVGGSPLILEYFVAQHHECLMGISAVLLLLLTLQILCTVAGESRQDYGTGHFLALVLVLQASSAALTSEGNTFQIAGESMQKSHLMKFVTGELQTIVPVMGQCAEQSERDALMARMEAIVDSDFVQNVEKENSSSKRMIEASIARSHLKKVGITAGRPLKRARKWMGQAAEKETKKLERLLREVLSWIMRDPDASIIGAQLRGKTDEQKLRMVKHCVGGKRVNTLATRMSPFRSFI